MALKTGIMGAAGYAGAELVRLLYAHPEFQVSVITSDAEAGTPIQDLYPAFAGCDIPMFTGHDDPALFDCDIVFLAVPHTVSLKFSPKLIEAGITVIDLSADYRLKDPAVYEKWYKTQHTSTDLLAKAAFGQPELTRDELDAAAAKYAAGEAVLVACAGCYVTATTLASAPLVRGGKTQGVIIADAVSGVSGAGKKCNNRTHFCSANDNVEAYGVGSHRHTPEMEQILGTDNRLIFTPHLVPLNRGILSTVTMQLTPEALESMTPESLQAYYEEFYANFPAVEVLPQGVFAKTSSVAGTIKAHISVVLVKEKGCVVAMGAIDNLCKGAAGQAVQCANIVCGFQETLGLPMMAFPV